MISDSFMITKMITTNKLSIYSNLGHAEINKTSKIKVRRNNDNNIQKKKSDEITTTKYTKH